MEQTNERQDEQTTMPAVVDEAAEKEKKRNASKTTAKLMTRPSFMAAHTAMSFVPNSMRAYGEPGVFEMWEEHREEIKKVAGEGDMTGPESMLMGQAMSLNSIYNWCAEMAGVNATKNLQHAEALMRMALKAQAQCTQALRVLGELKNPRQATFIKQQNNAAGHQQVNNGAAAAVPLAHGREAKETMTTEVLTDEREAQHAATLDTGATSGAGRENQTLDAVEVVNRAGD